MAKTFPKLNCAIYTRKSSEEGLEQEFNSLHAQREACEAFIASQKHEGWKALRTHYDDGGYSGGTMKRPGLQKLLADIAAHRVQVVVVYKVDRLTRALADFAKIIETFDGHGVSFVSVTQQFNTTTSMGRLTLNVLLSFAQFEREVTGERIRDKIAASKKKGMWMGGPTPLGYDSVDRKLVVNYAEAKIVRHIFRRYLDLGCVRTLKAELDTQGYRSKVRTSKKGKVNGGGKFERGALYALLRNRIYLGEIVHKNETYPGDHDAIVDENLWNAVNQKLEQNRTDHKRGKGARAPSPLVRILFDGQGNRLTPNHAKKGERRYRYYVCEASDIRLPAAEVENAVLSEIKRFLKSPGELANALAMDGDGVAGQQRLTERSAARADDLVVADLKDFTERVEIGKSSLSITCAKSVMRNWLMGEAAEASTDEDCFTITVPYTMRRRGVEKKLVLGNGADDQEPHYDHALIKAVAKAYVWNRLLVEGEAPSIRELARREGVTNRYIRKLLPLAFLSPFIMQSILNGEQASLSSLQIFLADKLSSNWQLQNARFNNY